MDAILFIETPQYGSASEAFKAAYEMGLQSIAITKRNYLFHNTDLLSFIHRVIFMEEIHEASIKKEISELLSSGYHIRAIISFVDPYVSLAAELSNEYCNSSISTQALRCMENKLFVREKLRGNRATIDFVQLNEVRDFESFVNDRFPKVMKSTLSNGSKGVRFIENKAEIVEVWRKMLQKFPKHPLILEDYVEGEQYVVELIVIQRNPIIVSVIKQEIERNVSFIVTAYDVLIEMDPSFYKELRQTVHSIVEDIGLTNGACHMELRFCSGQWKLIELNPRIAGGAMNKMIESAFGIHLVKETISLYLGNEPDVLWKWVRPVHTTFITVQHCGELLKVEGVEEAKKCPSVIDVHVKPAVGTILMPAVSMGQRYGYVMAEGKTAEEAKENADRAVALIKFYIDPI